MPVTVLYKPTRAKIASLEIDASLTETHVGDVDVTEHPVEKGANVADHIRPKDETLQIDALISNTPLPDPSTPTTLISVDGVTFESRASNDPTRAGAAYDELRRLKDSGDLITVVTALRTYEDMAITSLSVPRSSKDANGLRFSIHLKRVRYVNSQVVKVTTAEDKTKNKTPIGKKAGEETPDATRGKSVFKSIKDSGKVQDAASKLNKFLGF